MDGPNWSTGKWPIVFDPSKGYQHLPVTVSCGQCIGCRLERSRGWAVRCVHEASLYRDNCFITLTYSPEFCPEDMSLRPKDFQDFMKRLRRSAEYRYDINNIRFFHCGEYGELFQRPHHHAILFNFDFHDRILYKYKRGIALYTSEWLQELWPYGFSSVGACTFESSAYVARYILKKVNGDEAEEHYNGKKPEYITMSRRPGIAYDWISKFADDVYPKDYLTIRNGIKCLPPRYYDTIYDNINPETMKTIKLNREENAKKYESDNTPERLYDREYVLKSKMRQFKRSIE